MRRKALLRREIALLALVAAIGLFGYGVYAGAPGILARDSNAFLGAASVSISAAVPPNQYNELAAQLQQKQDALNKQASDLSAREAADARPSPQDYLGTASFIMSVLLFLLVAANFYLDARRDLAATRGALSVDLRNR